MRNPAAGGGRWVEVSPDRFVPWIITFSHRHADPTSTNNPTTPANPADLPGPVGLIACGDPERQLTFTAADGATAECHPPFPRPLDPEVGGSSVADPRSAAVAMAAYAAADRTVGVLLVRLGGYAVGVFAGVPPELVSSKTGSRPVHGRSAAGGWSQHRFARRRENQATAALRAAADAAVMILGTYRLDAVVLGGDKRSVDGLRGDTRLAPYLNQAVDRFLTVPDPRLSVLREAPRAFGAIRIRLTEP